MAGLFLKGGGTFIDNKISYCPNQKCNNNSSTFFFARNGNFEGVTNDIENVQNSIKYEKTQDYQDLLCLKCNKNKRIAFILNCCHKDYCSECAEKALQKKENCPLCRLPIKDIAKCFSSDEIEKCIICENNPVDRVIILCGHTCVCSSCLNNWFKTKNICPICRCNHPSCMKVFCDF